MRKYSRREINRIMSTEKVIVRIGRKGITEGLISEIKRQLNQRGYIKLKILKNIRSHIKDEDIEKLANSAGGRVVSKRGFVYLIVLAKPKRA
ncbi:MAG: YhbY family RNA-binding protein [Sulfolobales archaeon]